MGYEKFEEHALTAVTWPIKNATGTAWTGLWSAVATVTRIDQLVVSNTDTIDHRINFRISYSSNYCYLGGVLVPAGAGVGAIPAVDALAALQKSGQDYIILGVSHTFAVQAEVTVVGSYEVGIMAVGGTF
jgi:hypothetical protein